MANQFADSATLADGSRHPESRPCATCGIEKAAFGFASPAELERRLEIGLYPPCWKCVEDCLYSNERSRRSARPVSLGCRSCVRIPREQLDCLQHRVWILWDGLLAHGPKTEPSHNYPAQWRIQCCAATGTPEELRAAAIGFLKRLLWKRIQIALDAPTDARAATRDGLVRFITDVKRIKGHAPALLPEAILEFDRERDATRGFTAQARAAGMAAIGDILERLPINARVRDPGEEG